MTVGTDIATAIDIVSNRLQAEMLVAYAKLLEIKEREDAVTREKVLHARP